MSPVTIGIALLLLLVSPGSLFAAALGHRTDKEVANESPLIIKGTVLQVASSDVPLKVDGWDEPTQLRRATVQVRSVIKGQFQKPELELFFFDDPEGDLWFTLPEGGSTYILFLTEKKGRIQFQNPQYGVRLVTADEQQCRGEDTLSILRCEFEAKLIHRDDISYSAYKAIMRFRKVNAVWYGEFDANREKYVSEIESWAAAQRFQAPRKSD